MKKRLTYDDHVVLLMLIRGKSPKEICENLGMKHSTFTTRLTRMKRVLEVRTTYQLVALEMVHLLGAKP